MYLPNWIAADRASRMEGALASLCRCAGVAALILTTSAMAVSRIDLTELSLEELMSVEVTSVSRKAEKLAEAAAAVAVVTREDMRRSGATSLPAALRLAPACTWCAATPASGGWRPGGSTATSSINCWC